MDNSNLIKSNLICKVMEGSHAYGTATEHSDVDMRGIFCADPINLLTPFYPVKEIEDKSEEDTKYFELNHFMKLLLDQNPNILQILWVRESDILTSTDAYELLREKRKSFLTSKIAFTTSGYAHSQLLRIKGHKKWITNPEPVSSPVQKDYFSLMQWLGKSKVLSNTFDIKDHNSNSVAVSYGGNTYGLYPKHGMSLFRPDGSLNTSYEFNRSELPPPFAVVTFNYQQWNLDSERHKNYWNWKTNRNPVRAALEEKYGADMKHAAHLVRLLRMGLEALTDGVVNVYREDAEELLAIRNGSMSYEELIEYSTHMDSAIKLAYNKTSLRKKPDIKNAANIIMQVQKLIWEEK